MSPGRTVAPQAMLAAAAGITLISAGVIIVSSLYPGSNLVFFFFNACFFALVALALPRPRLYVYTFAVAFLGLGFWLKVIYHALAAPGFVEPVGDFSNTSAEWDSALLVAACGALGVTASRLAHLWWFRSAIESDRIQAKGPPRWFVRSEKSIWLLTIFLIIVINAANLHFAFYQIGVRPKLLLPLRGHVLLAWLVNIGLALWVAALVWWHYQARGTLGRGLLVPIVESFLSSTSAFSRINFLLHALPYAFAIADRRRQLLIAINRRWLYLLLAASLVLFMVAAVAVFSLRVYHYYGYATDLPGNEPLAGHIQRTISKQVPLLFIHRWVGLEGVLAVGAAERSPKRLVEVLVESPKISTESIFQRTAKTAYISENPEQFVFLANAGPVAILWFSGSLVIVFLGMAALAVVMFVTEEAACHWTGNPFLLALSGAALSNTIVQTTFSYLTLIFLVQLWLALAFLGALQRLKL
jgi:hypothetical protein